MGKHEACPTPVSDCKYDTPYADTHHLYWPRDEYTTPTERKFRQLECNIVRGLCRCLHDLEHQGPPPVKPSVDQMRQAVYGHE